MKPAVFKVLVPVVLTLLGLPLAAVASGQPAALVKRLPAGTSREAVEAIRQLEAAVVLDAMPSQSSEEAALTVLLEGLESPYDEVKAAALDLLALAVKQLVIPEEMLQRTVLPAVAAVEERHRTAAAPLEARLAELARRVLWHARVQTTPAGQRLQFLYSQLDNREDGYYYPFEALEYIVAEGTPGAKAAMESKLAEAQRRSLSDKLVRQVQVASREVEIQIELSRSDAASQASTLAEAFVTSHADRSFAGQSFRVWLIRRMADLRLEGLRELLIQAGADETLEPRVRSEAEAAVQRLESGASLPEDAAPGND